MPKKTASARGGASRNKPKSQKSIKLVRPTPAENDMQDDNGVEETPLAAPTPRATSTATASRPEVTATKKSEVDRVASQKEKDVADTSVASTSSAAARLAARRQTTLKQQVQRNANLITAEHYAYVRRDLIYILVLAVIMFSAIIVLHFVPAIGG
jgi:CHASE3 domain sensor protein